MANENLLGIEFEDFMDIAPEGDDSELEPKPEINAPTKNEDEIDEDINTLLLADAETVEEEDTEDAEDTGDSSEEEDPGDTEDKKDVKPDDKKKEESPEQDSSPFTLVYAKSLVDQGILSSFNEEEINEIIESEGEASALMHLVSSELDLRAKAISDSYEEDFREFAELKDLGMDTQKARELVSSKLELDKITDQALEENEDTRKKVLTNYYKKTTKFNDSRIAKLIDNHISLGEDEELSKEAVVELKEISKEETRLEKEKIKNEAEQAVKDRNVRISELKAKVQAMDEIIPGTKINKITKAKIEDMLLKTVNTTPEGITLNAVWSKRAEDPFGFDAKLAYLIHTGVFEGKTDKLVKSVKSQAVQSLAKSIKSQDGQFKVKTPRFEKETSDGLDGLEALL